MIKVIKFYGDKCQPCKQLAPIFDQVKLLVDGVSFSDINVDSNPTLAIQYKVRGIPTIVIEKDGHEVKRIMGVITQILLTSTINSFK
jgi:thioredoxin 1